MPNVESLLRDHVTLQIDCIDRLCLNGYVPLLQRPKNLWWFFTQHRGWPVPSPQLLRRLTDKFVAAQPSLRLQGGPVRLRRHGRGLHERHPSWRRGSSASTGSCGSTR